MSQTGEATSASNGTVVESYVRDVRILRVEGGDEDAEPRYRFEAPRHCGKEFEDREMAELYADVFFDANGFREEGTGSIGIPPEIVQAGKDTMAAYLLTQERTTKNWVVSFFGTNHAEIDRYLGWVRDRADEIRERVREDDLE